MSDLLKIENLSVTFETDEGVLKAVDDVSLDVRKGEVLGLVGESGCGKSVTALSVLRLIPSPPGRIASGRILLQGARPASTADPRAARKSAAAKSA